MTDDEIVDKFSDALTKARALHHELNPRKLEELVIASAVVASAVLPGSESDPLVESLVLYLVATGPHPSEFYNMMATVRLHVYLGRMIEDLSGTAPRKPYKGKTNLEE